MRLTRSQRLSRGSPRRGARHTFRALYALVACSLIAGGNPAFADDLLTESQHEGQRTSAARMYAQGRKQQRQRQQA